MSEMTNSSHNTDHASGWTVSVVIPACNAGRYISRALDSVLGQTRKADEIIVVDDGSTDDTAAQVAKYADKVKYIRQENQGASGARNTGIKAAGSEWVAFLDGDDEWLGDKLQRQIALLQRNPELDWCTGNFIRCLCEEGRQGPDLGPRRCRKLLGGKEYFVNYFKACMVGATGHTNMMMVKRYLLEEAGLFRPGQSRANDLDMWWRLAYQQPRMGYVSEPLAVYHLNVPRSLTQDRFPVELYCDLIARHLKLASQKGQSENFQSFAVTILRRWIRSMLFENRAADIRRMMKEFETLFPRPYLFFMRLCTTFPRITAGGCHIISQGIRFFHLRRRVIQRPKQ